MAATFGVVEKTEPVEKDSPLLPLMDKWIEHEKTLDTSKGVKAYMEDNFKTLKEARKFQSDIQLAARQRERGFRTTKFVVVDKSGEVIEPDEQGKYDDAAVKSVTVGGTLGARKRRNGGAKPETSAEAEA